MVPPGINAAAFCGIPDCAAGFAVVVAVIELCAEADEKTPVALEESLQSHCREQLARYKVPDQIRLIDKLPRNAMNKVVKPQLLHLFH